MARKRDYAAEYARRQKRARELGFKNYYERRTRPAPGAPKPSGEELARRRGHRAASDLEQLIRSGRVERVTTFTTRTRKGADEVTVIAWLDDGSTREFTLKGDKIDQIGDVLDQMGTDAPAIVGSPPGGWKLGGGGDEDLDEAIGGFEDDVDLDAPIPWDEAA